jgi:hypothetical protein
MGPRTVHPPAEIVGGYLVIPDRPGWGTEPNEEALRIPPKGWAGLLDYGRKAWAIEDLPANRPASQSRHKKQNAAKSLTWRRR